MPSKVDVATLIAKKDSTIGSLYYLLEEFNVLFEVQPVVNILENVYKEVEIKYRSVKKQRETNADKLCEVSTEGSEELVKVKSSEKQPKMIFYIVVKNSQLIKRRVVLNKKIIDLKTALIEI